MSDETAVFTFISVVTVVFWVGMPLGRIAKALESLVALAKWGRE